MSLIYTSKIKTAIAGLVKKIDDAADLADPQARANAAAAAFDDTQKTMRGMILKNLSFMMLGATAAVAAYMLIPVAPLVFTALTIASGVWGGCSMMVIDDLKADQKRLEQKAVGIAAGVVPQVAEPADATPWSLRSVRRLKNAFDGSTVNAGYEAVKKRVAKPAEAPKP
jgi:hypothetical protein